MITTWHVRWRAIGADRTRKFSSEADAVEWLVWLHRAGFADAWMYAANGHCNSIRG